MLLRGGARVYPAPSFAGRKNGSGGGQVFSPCIGRPLAETGNKDKGLGRCVAIHGEWYRNRGSRVARRPLSKL